MSMRLQTRLSVEMDNGETYEVVADQRDYAKAEVAGIPDEALHTRGRYLAWCAARRTKKYGASWERWNELDCAQVEAAGEDGDGELDPGRVDQNAGT